MTDTTVAPPLTLLIEDAAPLLRCTPEHYKHKLRTEQWPGVKIAGRWYVTPAQVQQALDLSSTQAREPEPPRPSGLSRRSRTFKRKSA